MMDEYRFEGAGLLVHATFIENGVRRGQQGARGALGERRLVVRQEMAVQRKTVLKRSWVRGSAVIVAAAAVLATAAPAQAATLKGVESATVNSEKSYVVDVNFSDGVKGKITFLNDDIFRYNVDPTGEFSEYAKPRSQSHVGRIPAQPDSSDRYKHAAPQVSERDGAIVITAGKTTITLDKATAKMTVKSGDKVLIEEKDALDVGGSTVQTLTKGEGEHFFGGGTQNGRIDHTGKVITMDKGGWEDGQNASPAPFYWSTKGYGVLRNTFQNGSYDFGKADAGTVSTSQEEKEFDAYYFLSEDAGASAVAQDILGDYYEVTGDPVLLPEYAFYLGHLKAYNRDGWSKEQLSVTGSDGKKVGSGKWETKGSGSKDAQGAVEYEYGMSADYQMNEALDHESLNGEGPTVFTDNVKSKGFPNEFSARSVLDEYQAADVPLGWFLPNDGYGAGYGQNGYRMTGMQDSNGNGTPDRIEALDANIDNLKKFTAYANEHGVATGLWTQSYLVPDDNAATPWHLLRDFGKEVEVGGVSSLKTDVAWVGAGYSMALDGTVSAYNTATTRGSVRPNLITLCGWAGTQRTGAIWSGDQHGGNWEYIRFHIPTFLGQSLSGNPNAGSDMDGIFSGDPIIATRDYQWKTFTSTMLDMDGWGKYRKTPFTHGDPYTGISRMYLKLKSQLMPYIYTSAASAANIDTGNGDTGMPMMRAMFLTDGSPYALSGAENLNYQFTFGNSLLVAPVYENSKGTGIGAGDDVRNGIYLPNYSKDDEDPTIWIDYFSGKQYRGGQVLEGYDAPLWKLPLFVKAGAIIPMYEENNNPQAISESNPDGLDKTRRVVEFWPAGDTEYTLFEDDGEFVQNNVTDGADGYGEQADVSYGGSVSTHISSKVKGDTATLTIDAAKGSYEKYDPNRVTTMVVNVSKEPTAIKFGDQELAKVDGKAALDALKDEQSGWCFVQEPNLNTGGADHPEEAEFAKIEMKTTPKVYIKLARTDVSKNAQSVVVEGFANEGALDADVLNKELSAPAGLTAPEDAKTPTSITLRWNEVFGATGYEVMADDAVHAVGGQTTFTHKGLAYNSGHVYKVRARNEKGYSEWSTAVEAASLEDPWRNVPQATVSWTGDYYGGQTEAIAFDHDLGTAHFHSSDGAVSNGDAMTIDFGLAYKLDKLEYFPRTDFGNGTVKKMKVEVSLDGNHWSEVKTDAWTWKHGDESKSIDFGNEAARYVRLTAIEAVGNFFSAREIKITKDDGTAGFTVGSTGLKEGITDGDLQNIEQYKGVENRGADAPTFGSQVADRYCDLNSNGVYDVYDYAFTLSQYNGGTKQEGAVSGTLMFVPDKVSAKRGETVTYTLYADGVKNVNALGAIFTFKSDDFDYVRDSLKGSAYVSGMENLSVAKTSFADGRQTINVAFANKGDKELLGGSVSVASFTLTAKRDLDAAALAGESCVTPYTAYLIGPKCDVVEYAYNGKVNLPEKPESTQAELSFDAFSKVTMTNSVLTQDPAGENYKKLVQNADGFAKLFDNDEGDGSLFELKWDTYNAGTNPDFKLPNEVRLPLDMTFELKEPRPLTSIEVLNRKGGNGRVKHIKAEVYFQGEDAPQTFEVAKAEDKFVFEISQENVSKNVVKVSIQPQASDGTAPSCPEDANNRMLTLREINFNYSTAGVTATDIELGKNDTDLYVGDVTQVLATVLPRDERYPFFTVSTKDPGVATASQVQHADGSISWYLRANAAGTTEVTVSALADSKVAKSYTVTVSDGVDTTELSDAIKTAELHSERAYTPETYKALKSVISEAKKLLESEDLSKDQAHAMVVKLQKAIASLEMKAIDFDSHFNKDASSGAKPVKANSSAGESPFTNALDYNESTFWHSNYNDQDVLPDYVIFDLGSKRGLTDVAFKTRQDGGTNGDIFEAQVYVGESVEALDGDGKGKLLGTFAFDNNGSVLENRESWQQMSFGATTTRYVKIEATKAGGDTKNAYASMSEVRFYEEQQAPSKDELNKLIENAKKEGTEGKTESIVSEFKAALEHAVKVAGDKDATETQIKDATSRLSKALEALKNDKGEQGGGSGGNTGGTDQGGDKVTVEKHPDGSQTVTTKGDDGSKTVVEVDRSGNVASVGATVSKGAAEDGSATLPMEGLEQTSPEDAPAISIDVPAGVSKDEPLAVTIPVAKAEGDRTVDPGLVVVRVDADGRETVLPKTAFGEDGVTVSVDGDCRVRVVDAAKAFPDVDDSDWFAAEVVPFATARGILNGVAAPDGSREFRGGGATSRAMFVAMLSNLELGPEAQSGSSFADVPAGAWYAGAAAWAAENGLVEGKGGTSFDGEGEVTREQIAVFLMRYASVLGLDTSARAEVDFPDAGEVSEWAREAVSWAVAEGLFSGSGATGELDPASGATRAETATVLMRFINGVMYK